MFWYFQVFQCTFTCKVIGRVCAVSEPYICTGRLPDDFTELCKRAKMVVVPPVVPRPHRPVSPPPAVQDEPKSKAKGGDKKKQAVEVIPEPEVEPETEV